VRLATFSPTAVSPAELALYSGAVAGSQSGLRAVAADQPKVPKLPSLFIMVGELAVADVMADRLAGSVAAGFMPVRWCRAGSRSQIALFEKLRPSAMSNSTATFGERD